MQNFLNTPRIWHRNHGTLWRSIFLHSYLFTYWLTDLLISSLSWHWCHSDVQLVRLDLCEIPGSCAFPVSVYSSVHPVRRLVCTGWIPSRYPRGTAAASSTSFMSRAFWSGTQCSRRPLSGHPLSLFSFTAVCLCIRFYRSSTPRCASRYILYILPIAGRCASR